MSEKIVKILYNGEEVREDEIYDSFPNPLIEYGLGCFETILIQENNRIFEKSMHLKRLFYGLNRLQIPLMFSQEQISSWIAKMQLYLPLGKQYKLKIIYGENRVFIYASEWSSDIKTYRLLPVSMTRSLPQVKTTSYADCVYAKRQAVAEGYTDALLMNTEYLAIETTSANLFWWYGDQLFTVTTECLLGVTQNAIKKYKGYISKKRGVTLSTLSQADGVFITNALRGIIPVESIGTTKIKNSQATHILQQQLLQWKERYSD